MRTDPAHLDAETLAAWMDGGLDASSSAAAEMHVSNCDRCRAMVAAFVRTEAPGTMHEAPGTMHEAPGTAHAAPGTLAPGTRSLWRWWFAPIAATAAAVTIWMVMPPQTPEPAAMREPAAELKAERTPPNAPPEQPAKPTDSAPGRAPDFAPAPSAESASARAQSSELRRDKLAQNQNQEAREQAAGAAADREAKLEAAPRSADTAFSKPLEARAETAAAAPLAEPVATPPALAAPPPPVAQKRLGPFEVVSPSPAFRWRIDTRGSIERSEDAGRAWFPIRLGTGESLTAGSSPSQNVCWLVGGRGVVLIAVDGVSFVRLPFPHSVDLVGVAATDGRMATVTAADGRTFTTTDTGRTWR